MSLQDDLKAKTLALISQQMATWVVEIQNHIRQHQANLVSALDELQENAARYDERINESEIEAGMAEVLAGQPPAAAAGAGAPAGPGFDKLKHSISEIEKGNNLSEALTYLVNEVAQYVDRAAMFIVKGTSAIGWYSRGFDQPEAVKAVNVPLSGDTVFRIVSNSKHALHGHIAHTPGTAAALARLGGRPQGILAVPLILRDKLAAILYCDSTAEEVPASSADLVEILVQFTAKSIDLLSLAPKPVAGRTTTAGTTQDRAAAIRTGGDEIRERAGVPRASAPPAAAPPPPPPPVVAADEGSSTLMFNPASITGTMKAPPLAPPAPPRAAPPPPPARAPVAPAVSPEEQKAHDDAKRFARLVVSEIKLYNEAKVAEGRRQKDLYERLKEDIERGRQMYQERVPPHVRDATNYFYDELVRILAGGEAAALGPM
jgi:hypothetical protein